MQKLIVVTAIGLLSTAFVVLSTNWNIDPNYSIKFSGKKAEGTFSGLSGVINFEQNKLQEAKIDVSIDANTIKTGNSTKDSHAKGESWFDVAKYPSIKFESTAIAKSSDGYLATGNLTLHGVSKTVAIPFQFTEQNGKGSFVGSFKVKRKDYNIRGNSFGFLVGDDFDLTLNVPVTK